MPHFTTALQIGSVWPPKGLDAFGDGTLRARQ